MTDGRPDGRTEGRVGQDGGHGQEGQVGQVRGSGTGGRGGQNGLPEHERCPREASYKRS